MNEIPNQPSLAAPGRPRLDLLLRPLRPPETHTPKGFREYVVAGGICILLVGLALAVGLVVERFLGVPNILLVFLPVVLLASVRYGFWLASLTSLLSVSVTSYFTHPLYSFAVSEPGNVWALLIFLLVSAFTSSLATQIRQREAAVTRYSGYIEQFYALNSSLSGLSTPDAIVKAAAAHIGSMFSRRSVILTLESGGLRFGAASEPKGNLEMLDAIELAAAGWAAEHGQPAGRGTREHAEAGYLYLPLDAGHGAVGVLGISGGPADPTLSEEQLKLIDVLRDQVAVNIDRAKLAEQKLATDMLAETEKLRTALLTSISHDLRTPLASILGNVSSLRRYGQMFDESTREEMLAASEDETMRMSRFVDNLLHMTRIDAGVLRPTIENVDVSDLVGSALKRVEKNTARHEIQIDLPPDLPMVSADFVLAEHALVNLIDNAAKYSPSDSRIEIAVADDGDTMRFSVSDRGPGIPSEQQMRIFERFFRADAADHRRAGSGLGLAICKGFTEAMGGVVRAGNRVGGGAVVTVTLPKARSELR